MSFSASTAQSYKDQLAAYAVKANNNTITASEIVTAKNLSAGYYTYLSQNSITYGKAGYDVVRNEGGFGNYANAVLNRTLQEQHPTWTPTQISNASAKVAINLAYEDSSLRSATSNGQISSTDIALYHYDVYAINGLPKSAWGGALFEEFGGSGSYLRAGGYDSSIPLNMRGIIRGLAKNETSNGINAIDAYEKLSDASDFFDATGSTIGRHIGDTLLAAKEGANAISGWVTTKLNNAADALGNALDDWFGDGSHTNATAIKAHASNDDVGFYAEKNDEIKATIVSKDGLLNASDRANSLAELSNGDLSGKFGSASFVDANDSNFVEYMFFGDDLEDMLSDQGGITSGVSVGSAGPINDKSFVSLISEGAQSIIQGTTYAVEEIAESLVSAGQAVGDFVQKLADSGTTWFTEGGAQTAFSSWLSQNIDEILLGDMDGDEALINLGQYMAGSFLSNFVVSDVLDAEVAIAKVLYEEFGVGAGGFDPFYTDANGKVRLNVIEDANGNSVPINPAGSYAKAFSASLSQMTLVFVTSGFDAETAVKVGVSTLAGELAKTYLVEKEIIASGSFAAGAVATAVMTAVQGLLDFDGDWGQLGIQVGTAVAIYGATQGLAAGIGGLSTSLATKIPVIGVDPATIIAGILLSFIVPKLIGGIFGSKKLYPGEYQTLQGVLDSIYQFQNIEVDGQMVPAIVAVNQQGSTVLASNIGYVVGNVGADILVGDNGVQNIQGNGGSDYLEAREGDDVLLGGEGNDHLNGGDGDDILQGDAGDDLIFGEAGIDTVIAGAGDDFIHLGTGNDVANAGAGDDYVLAGGGDDAIDGDAGDDMMDGGYGNDTIAGGAGNDLILGNLGNDVISGDDGGDSIFGAEGTDQLYGGAGNDYIDGGADSDLIYGENGDDLITGGAADDFADGGLGDDNILGGDGNDVLLGGMDDDYLVGEAGDDSLDGGFGNDMLKGGIGVNTLQGGEGSDTYIIGVDSNEHDNILVDTGAASDSDTILLTWLTQANALSGLALTRDGDDLTVSYNSRVLATVTDQFVAGQGVERIELAGNYYIDLPAVSYDPVTDAGSFAINANLNGMAYGVEQHEILVADSLQSQDLYWNNTYLTKLSDMAYEEQINDMNVFKYYDGTEVGYEKRKRGKAGGHYSVYKLTQPGTMDGTEETTLHYSIQDAEDQLAATPFGTHAAGIPGPFSNFINGAVVTYSTVANKSIQDIAIDGVVVSSKVAGEQPIYTAGSTIYGLTYAQRVAAGTSVTTDVGVMETGDDLLVGAYWDETINGKSGNDVLVGNNGNDVIVAGDGDDWAFGGDGNDTITAGFGDDLIFGGDGNDSIGGWLDNEAIFAGAGDDTVAGDDGDDWIDGGAGNDSMRGDIGNDVLLGRDGNDTLEGRTGNDILHGNDGDDKLYGNEGDDTLIGGSGNDSLYGGTGNDVLKGDGSVLLNGNEGSDTVVFDTVDSSIIVDLHANTVSGGGMGDPDLISIENVILSSYNDTIYSALGANSMDGGGGQDLVRYDYSTAGVSINLATNINTGGFAAGDTLLNVENLVGSGLNDTIVGTTGNNYYNTLAGDDVIYADAGSDIIDGSDGTDVVSYYASTSAVQINLNTIGQTGGYAQGDELHYIEWISGSIYNDTLTGNGLANNLNGAHGNDTILGGAGADTLDGGAGTNTVSYADSNAAVNVLLSQSTAQAGGTAQGDILVNFDNLVGSTYNDTLTGNTNANAISGGNGNDLIYGDVGNDTLDGGAGSNTVSYINSTAAINVNLANATGHTGGFAQGDALYNMQTLVGSTYNDTISGSASNDVLNGGAGADSISGAAGHDTIIGGAGADTLNGGTDINTLSYEPSSAAVNVSLALTTAQSGGDAAGDIILNFNDLWGSGYNDTLAGNSGNNFIAGVGGDDIIMGDLGSDLVDGGLGIDMMNYFSSNAAVTVNLGSASAQSGGHAQGDILYNVENLVGSGYNDSILGSSANNLIDTWDGNDTLNGGQGNDYLNGGAGNDTFIFNASNGNDTIYGFDGEGIAGGDLISFQSAGISNFTQLQSLISYNSGASTATITIDGSNSITIVGVTQNFVSGDFAFV